MSGEDFSSLSALAQMAETAAPKDPARAKKAAGPDPRLLAGQVATFKSLVLESPQVARMIKKARRQGIYAVRPWQWGALALLLPLTTLAVAYAGWRASRETRSYLAMNQAVIAARRGDVRLADQEIRRSLSFGYSPVAGNHAVALALVESKRYDAALDFFDRARLASGYTAIEPQLDAVRVSLERLAPSDALERLQVASEVAGKYPEYFLLRARAHRLLGDYDRARADAGEALERNPNSIAARWILFEIGRARGDTDAVRENRSILLARTLRGDEPTEVQIGLARLYLTQDRRKPAREILDRVLPRATEEHYAEIYYTRGLLGIGERRFGEALADLDEAVRRAPRNPEFLARRAEILYGDGRIEEAIRDLQRATEADPLHARARYNLAWILWADARDPRAAHPHFEAARGQVQDLPHLAYALAATLRNLPRRSASRSI